MTTAGIYSNVAQSSGLYATTATTFTASTAFQLYAFYVSSVAPATPTGGSWNFKTNTGTTSNWLDINTTIQSGHNGMGINSLCGFCKYSSIGLVNSRSNGLLIG